MEPLMWSILLLVVALGLIALEVFIPSGGVLGVLAGLAVIASLALAFTGGMMTGTLMMVVTIVVVPLAVAGAVRWWPNTPLGRMIVLGPPASEDDVLPDTLQYRLLGELVGKRGVAKTKMLPSGVVLIDGEAYDATSDGTAIDPGQPIRVTAVRANRIVVLLDEHGDRGGVVGGNDMLAQSAESLGIQSLDDPG